MPQCFSDLVEKLLAKDPRHRYQTAVEVGAELNAQLAVLNQLPSDRFPMVGQLASAPPKGARKWYVRAAILAAFTAAAAVCGVALRPRQEERPVDTAPPTPRETPIATSTTRQQT